MLFNLDWLQSGKLFPPTTEIPRLKGYDDNSKLFDDDPAFILKPYIDRLNQIVNRVKDETPLGITATVPNYWQLSTIKTCDLMVGDKPKILCAKAQKKLDDVLQESNFFSKLTELVIDNDSLGDCIVRPYIDAEGKRNFVANNPSMWFPVVNEENIKEVITDVLAWTVCVKQNANHPEQNRYELFVKIQDRGSNVYEFRRYAVGYVKTAEYIHKPTNENCGKCDFFSIGALLESRFEDTPSTQLVIQIPNITTSRSLFGVSAYDRMTPIIAEIMIRESLADFILDENSAPRMGAPESAFIKNKDGRWVLKSGGRSFVVKPSEQMPVYITWDGNLQSNENRIAELKKELYALCEMGTIISHDDLNSSQGYDALEVKMTNPKLKVRRMATLFESPLKKLIAFLLDDTSIDDSDISIIFNDGLPSSESRNIDMAQRKKNLGVSLQSILTEYFGLTEDEAQEEVERARQESADAFAEQFASGRNSLFGGGQDSSNDNEEDSTTENGNEPVDDGG